jgi:hypothetical protein
MVKFECYRRYTFTYAAWLGNGMYLCAFVGGNKDAAYDVEVDHQDQLPLSELDTFSAELYKNGVVVHSFVDD